jgi:hypothetical protein
LASGFIGLRNDRTVVVLDAGGANPRELVAEPGQHVLSIAVRGDRALALLEAADKVRGRWVQAATGSWGAATPDLPIDGERAALSVDHRRIAGMKHGQLVIVDAATGKVKSRFVDEDGFVNDPSLRPIGFSRSGQLALVSQDQLCWWDGKDLDTLVSAGAAAVGGNDLIAESDRSLVIAGAQDDGPEYLGYRMGSLSGVAPKGKGFLATDGVSLVELDAQFATRRVFELPKIAGNYELTTLRLVDAKHVVGDSYSGTERGTYLVDLEKGNVSAVAAESMFVDFNQRTGLVAYFADGHMQLRRWDRKKKAYSDAVTIPGSAMANDFDRAVVLLEPATPGGASVAHVRIDMELLATITFFKVSGEPMKIVQTKQKTRQLTDENAVAEQLISASLRRGPVRNPARTLSAQLHDERITLRDATGADRWTIPAAGATALLWTSSGELTATGEGFGRLDLDTGAWLERRCGWIFERSYTNDAEFFAGASMCEAP